MLSVRDLKKSYGALKALDGVSFEVRPGEILGLLGPNGAGKTTSVSIACGLLRPDGGEVRVAGKPLLKDDDAGKRRMGLVPQDLALHEELTAIQNLRFFGALYGLGGKRLLSSAQEALDFVGLKDRMNDRVGTFSGGMKRRLNLAAGLLHDPEVLLLDEPTVGVDPQSRNAIFENLEALRQKGKALLYTTHYMEEAERLCDRLVILDHGRVIAVGTLAELRGRLAVAEHLVVEMAAPVSEGLLGEIRTLPGVLGAEASGPELKLRLADLSRTCPEALALLFSRGAPFHRLRTERPDLEEIFLHLTGKELRDS
jgi:ABC-2 type transport system ATP-binding protein